MSRALRRPQNPSVFVRYFGWYSNKNRGLRAKAAGQVRSHLTVDRQQTPGAGQAPRRWAALIKRHWQVDPLQCPRCGSGMKIVSLIQPTQPDVIKKILQHCGLWQQPLRAPPDPHPPHGPRELRYVSDLAYVDASPVEPVWSD
ncbi:MAG: hypothetical protein ACYS0G_03240 [Planctomycetota bacterium]